MKLLRGLYVLDAPAYALVYGPDERREISKYVQMDAPPQTRESLAERPELMADVEVLFSGWGAPLVDEGFLSLAPRLKAIFYAAGATGYWATNAVWERGIAVTTASAANSIPVAEYTLAMIILSLKHTWQLSRQTRDERQFPARDAAPGNFNRTVGLVSLGSIGRTLLRLLRPIELRVIAYDPFVTADEAAELGVELVSLAELFQQSDVVSLHTPLLSETVEMIRGKHLASMRAGGTFINTARGELVQENELIDVAKRRNDLQFVLDVTSPEPPRPNSPLYELPNVVLTPHIAGSVGQECRRMGQYMVQELERYVRGEPMLWSPRREIIDRSAHRPAASHNGSAGKTLDRPTVPVLAV